jgi:hypothetical protein
MYDSVPKNHMTLFTFCSTYWDMTQENHIVAALAAEAHRIEEDTLHSFKGQYNTANMWSVINNSIGIPTTITAGLASIDAFSQSPQYSGYLLLGTTVLAATQTFLNPAEKAAKHKSAGGEYQALRNRARRFHEIDLHMLKPEELRQKLEKLTEKRDELNRISPAIPRWAYWRAKKDVDNGLSDYRVDTENKKEAVAQ